MPQLLIDSRDFSVGLEEQGGLKLMQEAQSRGTEQKCCSRTALLQATSRRWEPRSHVLSPEKLQKHTVYTRC